MLEEFPGPDGNGVHIWFQRAFFEGHSHVSPVTPGMALIDRAVAVAGKMPGLTFMKCMEKEVEFVYNSDLFNYSLQ